ncbi:MAG: hypothetical protein MJ065_05400 [Oscillospiraceae bacterium]|nr:hypothetical protein [Oscillospiraceae bacterium]
MCVLMQLVMLAEETEERVNITPVLLRFLGKFFLIFATVAVIAILTPRMAKWIDDLRARRKKDELPEDPRCKQVRGPYDMPEPKENAGKNQENHPDGIHEEETPDPPDEKPPYQPKH